MTPERRYMVMKWAAADTYDGWSPDLAAWADAWVAVQLDEEERLAYEQAYARGIMLRSRRPIGSYGIRSRSRRGHSRRG